MEQPGVGSSSAALHSESTQSFFFQGPFKIRPKVCWGVWRSVSHAARYILLPATTESEEQRRDKSKKPTVNEKEDPAGLCLPCQCVTLWGHPCLLLPPPTWPGPGQSVAPTGTAVQWTPPHFSRCSVGWGNTSSAICTSTGNHYLWQLALLFGREKAPSLHFHCKMFGNCPLGLIRQRHVCEYPRGREGYRKRLMVMYHCTCQLVCHKRLKLPASQLSD